MKVDAENDKEVLAVRDVQISLHKEQHPDDTASGDEIGLSSEDEADEMSEDDQIGRKYKRRAPPLPVPDEPVPPIPLSQILNLNLLPRQVAPLDWPPYRYQFPCFSRFIQLLGNYYRGNHYRFLY